MKFIHAADLHLDTPFASISNFSKTLQDQLKKSTYAAADKVFDAAISESVDFVILAGDIFDNTERTLHAQTYLKNQFLRLAEQNIQVYLVYGNHDYYRNDFSVINFPDNVTVFGPDVSTVELVSRDGQRVGISGFSYHQNHITNDMVSSYPSRGNFDYQIGILHAGVGDGNYAPFTVKELLTKEYDYWALGHIHKREILHNNPLIVYSGDTQGRNQNETESKGFYLVTVNNRLSQAEFIPSSIYVWKTAEISAYENDTIDDLFSKISNLLKSFSEYSEKYLLTLTIDDAQNLDENVIKAIDRDEILQHFSNKDPNAFLYKVYTKFNQDSQLKQMDRSYWDDSEQEIFNLDDIKDLDNRLFTEAVIRNHMDSPEFIEHIKELTVNQINKKNIGD